jgi:hypothetical protein
MDSGSVGVGQPLPFCIDHLGLPFAQRQDNAPMSPMIRVTTLAKPGIVSFG